MHPLPLSDLRTCSGGGGFLDLLRDLLDDGRINHSTDADPLPDTCVG